MKMRYLPIVVATLVLAFGAFAQDETPKGITMNLVQELKMGQLSVKVEGTQSFLPPASFRLVGSLAYTQLGMEGKMLAVSDGKVVKQYVETVLGPQAITVDLKRIQQKLPGYKPSDDYDPMVYKNALGQITKKKELPAVEMDGAPVDGYEFNALDLGFSLIPESLGIMPMPKPEKYRIWINPQDGMLRKMEAEDTTGVIFFTMALTNVKTAVNIPSETFKYEFPENVTPVDMTDTVLGLSGMEIAPQTENP